jgi:hypothetical protein
MCHEASTTNSAPPVTAVTVHLRTVRNDQTGQCGWGAVILSGNAVGEEIEQIGNPCNAERPYDADILGASAVLEYIKTAYAPGQLKSIVFFAAKGLAEGLDRTIGNQGRPTGKPAFRPLWIHLFELVQETGAVFKRMPTFGRAAEISDLAHQAARKAVGLSIDLQKQPVGKVACPTSGCEAKCDAYLLKDGRWRSWCQRCRDVFFSDPSEEASGGR